MDYFVEKASKSAGFSVGDSQISTSRLFCKSDLLETFGLLGQRRVSMRFLKQNLLHVTKKKVKNEILHIMGVNTLYIDMQLGDVWIDIVFSISTYLR